MLNFGQRSKFLSTAAVVATLLSGAANAQQLRDTNGPAEFPPASFTANQYVDSRGCVFVRAGIGGTVDWVPRVSRDREQLCGFQQTEVAGTSSSAPSPNVPNPLDTQVAGLAPRPAVAAPAPAIEAAPAPVIAAAPAPAPVVQTSAPVAANAPAPRLEIAPQANLTGVVNPLATAAPRPAAATPSPRVITAPAPVAAPRVLTQAQACDGLTGVQPNLVSQRTGQPIDCGGSAPAPQVAAAVTAPPVQAPSPSRLSRAQACADIAATGRQYVSATTGLPIQCGTTQTQAARPAGTGFFGRLFAGTGPTPRTYSNPLDGVGTTFAPIRPQTVAASSQIPYSNPLDAAPGSTTFTPGVNTRVATACAFGGVTNTAGQPIRCGPQALSPSGGTNIEQVRRARTATTSQGFLGRWVNPSPPPFSNPDNGFALGTPTVPTGFVPVWGDGRLNTQRGLPNSGFQVRNAQGNLIRTGPQAQSPSGTVRFAATPTAQIAPQQQVTRRAVAPAPQQPELINGHRYVQVGTFATRTQAQDIAQSLRARGLPMRIGVFDQNGTAMRIVLAGPFGSDTQLQNALGTARGAGFSGAFTRR